MYAQKQKIGASPVEQSAVMLIQEQYKDKSQHIVLPSDYLVASGSLIGPLRISTQSSIVPNDIIVTIGPKTLEYVITLLSGAKTIFINGLSGLEERAETLEPAYKLLKHAAHSEAFTVICGGNTISLAQQYNLLDDFDLCSTGGGATLAYISGQTLPGLAYL
jgi:phosphoglycerate kinase